MIHSFAGITEPVASLSHLLGALVCIISSVRLIGSHRGSRATRLSLKIFSITCIALLLLSGLFHLLPPDTLGRVVLKKLDHAAIFLFIAGTFTPIHVVLFRGVWRWAPLVVIWAIGIVGVALKIVYFSSISDGVGTTIYLAMGWLGAVSASLIWWQNGFAVIQPLLFGALFYSVGTVFEFLGRPTLISGVIGPHELFHLAVLGGIAQHWRFICRVLHDASAAGHRASAGSTAASAETAVFVDQR